MVAAGAGGRQWPVEQDGRAALRGVAPAEEVRTRVRVDVLHPVMRAGWEVILQGLPDLMVVRFAGGVAVDSWDVTFVDTGDSGFTEAVDRIGRGPVVAAVDAAQPAELLPRIAEGTVNAVVSADDTAQDLSAGVAAAARGHIWVSAALTWMLTAAKGDLWTDHHELTERELELAHMLLAGATNADLAQAHDISVRTVKFHVSNIMRKLGVARRSQIAHALSRS